MVMRLIHAETSELKTFDRRRDIPEYAILSHTWAEDGSEVSFQEFVARTNYDKAGWAKIDQCCQKALKDGWQYVWIDTCCIDKTSSAELSEAINSMYRYYEDSAVCYAHLSDVSNGPFLDQHLQNSRWFKRGWTLQEMLAPAWVVFLDASWEEIGTRSSLKSIISSITGVNLKKDYRHASVAQKFAWAAHRQTTRVEDRAYSLLGLFGIHLPLLYGEGEMAFRRLQEEIVRVSSDESIFAWTKRYKNDTQFGESEMSQIPALAPHIECFKDCRHIGVCERYQVADLVGVENERMPEGPFGFLITKNAININTLLYYRDHTMSREYCILLNCRKSRSKDPKEPRSGTKRLAIYLEEKEGMFYRSHCDEIMEVEFPIVHGERQTLRDWNRSGFREITVFNEYDQQAISKLSGRALFGEEYLVTLKLSGNLEQRFLSAAWAGDFTGDPEERMQIRFDLPNDASTPHEFKIMEGEYAPMLIRVKDGKRGRPPYVLAVGVRSGCVFLSLTSRSKGGLLSFSSEDSCEGLMPSMLDFFPSRYGMGKIFLELSPRPSRSPRHKEYVLRVVYDPRPKETDGLSVSSIV